MEPSSAQIEASLQASRREGVAAQIASGALDYYLVPFALFLGAPSARLSFLSAVSQFFVVDFLRAAGDRRRLLICGAALQSLALAPLAALAAFGGSGRVGALFSLVCVFRVVGAVMGPPWGSLMSDYLPER